MKYIDMFGAIDRNLLIIRESISIDSKKNVWEFVQTNVSSNVWNNAWVNINNAAMDSVGRYSGSSSFTEQQLTDAYKILLDTVK